MPDLSIDGGATFIAFDMDTVTDDEAIALEDAFGVTWTQFLDGIGDGSIKSQKALVWLAQRRETPDLQPADVVYELSKFMVRTDDEEGAVPLPGPEGDNGNGTPEPSPSSSGSDPGSGST